jgi:hypothetical protein
MLMLNIGITLCTHTVGQFSMLNSVSSSTVRDRTTQQSTVVDVTTHSSSLGRSTVTCGYYQYVLESKVQFSRLFVNGGGLNADDVYSSTLELPHCTASGDSTRKGFRGTCRRREGIEILRAIDSCRSTYYIPFDSPTRSERGERRRGEAEHI